MCGFIVGQSDSEPLPVEEWSPVLEHRGPDEAGHWKDEALGVALAQQRLSVIDRVGGSQPMERGGYVLVYNGELYNYRLLRDELTSRGWTFRTESDTEVLLQGFRAWGTGVLDRARGMFSFCLWDPEQERLVLARDPLGQKPLCYYAEDGVFLAASEIQALLQADRIPRSADPASLSWYLSLGYVPSPRSGFAKIKKIPPGHYLLVREGIIRDQVRYWDPVKPISAGDSQPTESEIRSTIRQAVDRRLVSDVPLGSFLSGGIDSTIVTGLVQELTDKPVRTVSIGFDEADYDETDFAREAAEFHGTDHLEHRPGLNLVDLLPRLVRHFGEPFADSSAVPTFYLARETARHVTVALSGDGADELFGGYRRYRAMRMLGRINGWVPGSLRSLVQELSEWLGDPGERRSRTGEWLRMLQCLGESPVRQYLEMVGIGGERLKKNLARGPLRRPASRGGDQWLERWFRRFQNLEGMAARSMAVDLMSYLPEDLLVKADITSMMNSLECRSPFLDRDVVELALRLPENQKIRGNTTKAILRDVFADYLPKGIQDRGKQGFGVPLSSWFRTGSRSEYLREVLLSPGSGFFSLIDRVELETLHEAHVAGERDAAPFLWALVMLKLWMKEFDVRV